MADFKEEAATAFYTTKADGKIFLARSELNKLAASGPTGKAGPGLAKVIQEFDGYVAAWEALKKDPAFQADAAQRANFAQAVDERVDIFVALGQQADAIDDAKASAAKAKSDADYSKMADDAGKKGPAKPATPPPATPPPAAAAPPPAAAAPAPAAAAGGDKMLLIAAVGLGAAALLLGKSRK
jgi:hypothetical protein